MIWDVGTGQAQRKLRGHAGRVNCVCFNEESSLVLSASVDSSVRIWDLKSRKNEPVQTLDEAKDVVMSIMATGHEILTASLDGWRSRSIILHLAWLKAGSLPCAKNEPLFQNVHILIVGIKSSPINQSLSTYTNYDKSHLEGCKRSGQTTKSASTSFSRSPIIAIKSSLESQPEKLSWRSPEFDSIRFSTSFIRQS